MVAILVWLGLVYLAAAVPFGLVLSTLYGGDVDLRTAGSGNIGATNVARVFGWRIAAATLALDAAKGGFAVLGTFLLFPGVPGLAGVVAVMAFVGHCWPVYLDFRGGKGVATTAGAMLAYAPGPALIAAATWGAVLATTGRSSIAALVATATMLAATVYFDPAAAVVVAVLAVGIVVRHLSNLGRLARGEEPTVVAPVHWGRAGAPKDPRAALEESSDGGPATSTGWRH
jgi:glycerol-3-phosphate acyltransferase PlsY